VESPPAWSDVPGELSTEGLQTAIAEAAAGEQRSAGPLERVQHRRRRHAAEVELRLRTEGTLPVSDLFRAALLALIMTVALLAFAGYLASTVDGSSALFGLLGLPLGAVAARLAARTGGPNTWALAVVVSASGAVALLAHASRQTALLIVVSTAAGLWYDTVLVPFVVGLSIFVRRASRRPA
jgi:hypothetical protein